MGIVYYLDGDKLTSWYFVVGIDGYVSVLAEERCVCHLVYRCRTMES